MARRAHIEVRIYVDFEDEDAAGLPAAGLFELAEDEVRQALAEGQRSSGLWQMQDAHEAEVLWGSVEEVGGTT